MQIEERDTISEGPGRGSAHRLQRVWGLVEHIAQNPGRRRNEMARHFAVSERQMQCDLELIRDHLGLPLVRRGGYRFDDDATTTQQLTLGDLQLLMLVLSRARSDPYLGVSTERWDALFTALSSIAPPHLRPFLKVTPGSRESRVLGQLLDAAVQAREVVLNYPFGVTYDAITHPVVQPLLVLAYDDVWYVIGRCRTRTALVVLPVEPIESISRVEPIGVAAA